MFFGKNFGFSVFLVGVPRQLAGRAFHCNLFFGKKPQKRISALITNAH